MSELADKECYHVFFYLLDVYRKSRDEIRPPNSPSRGPGHQTQDLVVGIAPLKLMQNSPLPPNKDERVDDNILLDNTHTLWEDEYRSLQLEHLKFAEEERGERTGSASFPLAYGRRLKDKKRVCQQMAKKRELISPPNQKETKEEGPAWRELQQKVHTLEHVYNQECFLRVHFAYVSNILLLIGKYQRDMVDCRVAKLMMKFTGQQIVACNWGCTRLCIPIKVCLCLSQARAQL